MGLFGNRKSREERGVEIANKVASGKGFYGRVTKAFLGDEDFSRLQGAVGAINNGVDVQALVASGVPTVPATVVSIEDTGQLVNFDPVVDLVVQFADESRFALRTLVSKLRIPRVGEAVRLVADPRLPGAYLYAGPAE
ncbi:hypothetical protein [Actinophytocola sp. NPDC049390]|uniref:hypothetical protein n=1 Tax=Actinophytocola sp. NPDC049390 TaxID=3363894 RepID=UPI00379EDFF7